jgi:hypothetical protein
MAARAATYAEENLMTVNRAPGDMTRRNGRENDIMAPDASIGELVKQLGQDLETLVRQEVALGKAELGQIGRRLAKDTVAIATAAFLGLVGVFALTAGVIILVGRALEGRYWLSALLVGAAVLVVAWVLIRKAIGDMKRNGLAPKETIATLREDKDWAARQARELKQDLTSNPARSATRS